MDRRDDGMRGCCRGPQRREEGWAGAMDQRLRGPDGWGRATAIDRPLGILAFSGDEVEASGGAVSEGSLERLRFSWQVSVGGDFFIDSILRPSCVHRI